MLWNARFLRNSDFSPEICAFFIYSETFLHGWREDEFPLKFWIYEFLINEVLLRRQPVPGVILASPSSITWVVRRFKIILKSFKIIDLHQTKQKRKRPAWWMRYERRNSIILASIVRHWVCASQEPHLFLEEIKEAGDAPGFTSRGRNTGGDPGHGPSWRTPQSFRWSRAVSLPAILYRPANGRRRGWHR